MCKVDCKFNREQEIREIIDNELSNAYLGLYSAHHDHAQVWEPELYRQLVKRLEVIKEKIFPDSNN